MYATPNACFVDAVATTKAPLPTKSPKRKATKSPKRKAKISYSYSYSSYYYAPRKSHKKDTRKKHDPKHKATKKSYYYSYYYYAPRKNHKKETRKKHDPKLKATTKALPTTSTGVNSTLEMSDDAGCGGDDDACNPNPSPSRCSN